MTFPPTYIICMFTRSSLLSPRVESVECRPPSAPAVLTRLVSYVRPLVRSKRSYSILPMLLELILLTYALRHRSTNFRETIGLPHESTMAFITTVNFAMSIFLVPLNFIREKNR